MWWKERRHYVVSAFTVKKVVKGLGVLEEINVLAAEEIEGKYKIYK
jgi:hypothetical protein